MSKKTLKFRLEVELEIDGKQPSKDELRRKTIECLNDNFPNFVFDDEALDCCVFVNSWEYTPVGK